MPANSHISTERESDQAKILQGRSENKLSEKMNTNSLIWTSIGEPVSIIQKQNCGGEIQCGINACLPPVMHKRTLENKSTRQKQQLTTVDMSPPKIPPATTQKKTYIYIYIHLVLRWSVWARCLLLSIEARKITILNVYLETEHKIAFRIASTRHGLSINRHTRPTKSSQKTTFLEWC